MHLVELFGRIFISALFLIEGVRKIFNPDIPFEESVDQMIDDLHASTPIDPDQPVLVAGEPEDIMRDERKQTGIPVPSGLRSAIEDVCRESNAEFLFI